MKFQPRKSLSISVWSCTSRYGLRNHHHCEWQKTLISLKQVCDYLLENQLIIRQLYYTIVLAIEDSGAP